MSTERWKRMEDLFHAAEALPPGERDRFLAHECSDDEPLRHEVASLLEQSDRDGMLSEPAVAAPALPDLMVDRHRGQLFRGYRLQKLLGAGGMGEVYLARDTRLGRDVAVKVLPQEFTSDPDRLARFEREARILATLNHPNICGIYGLEEADGIRFLVLELVAGQTLAVRLAEAGGPLPVSEALDVAQQIAQALEVAHDGAVIHRDLKPSNIKITPTHVVKVLDFGLAKSVAIAGAPDDLTQAADGADDASVSRFVMGTAAYMSPEQARGHAVDKRADIWAFGVVLFEMLAGKRPFRGETTTETLASILKTEPDWTELPPALHPGLRRLLHRCLEKDPRRRLQSIAEARVQIESLIRGGDDDELPTRSFARLTSARLAWTIAALLSIAALVLAKLLLDAPHESPFYFSVVPPPGAALVTEESPVVSPDGRLLAFVGYDPGGTQRLYVVTLGESTPAEPLEKTEGASLPFWSPDSRALGFFAQGSLRTIDLATGGDRRLAAAGAPRGGTWSKDDVIVFVPGPRAGPRRISATGDGSDQAPISPEAGNPPRWLPSFLPDGRHFLEFVPTVKEPQNSGVWAVALDTGKRNKITDSQSNAIYSQGHLFFLREGTLWARKFDLGRLMVEGDPIRVADGIGLNPVTNQALFSASSTGTLAYFAGMVGRTELVWRDRDGSETGRPGVTGIINTVALSPDDTSVVYDQANPQTATFDIWRLVFDDERPEKLTLHPANDVFPLWSPEGKRFVFTSVREAPPQMFVTTPAAAGGESLLFKSPAPVVATGFSDKGRTLVYTATDSRTAIGDIMAVDLQTGISRAVVETANDERYGTVSPDGKLLAYVSNESSVYEVFVRALGDRPDLRRQISVGRGSQPQWGRNGVELVYMGQDRRLFAVDIQVTGEMLTKTPPRPLFPTRTKTLETQGTARTYAIDKDARRFLIATAVDDDKSASISLVKDWRPSPAK
jgi:eukaryotic-like serine/threonine-protein kinase